jgi:hypothetical protein
MMQANHWADNRFLFYAGITVRDAGMSVIEDIAAALTH